jgi:hypothetical protein
VVPHTRPMRPHLKGVHSPSSSPSAVAFVASTGTMDVPEERPRESRPPSARTPPKRRFRNSFLFGGGAARPGGPGEPRNVAGGALRGRRRPPRKAPPRPALGGGRPTRIPGVGKGLTRTVYSKQKLYCPNLISTLKTRVQFNSTFTPSASLRLDTVGNFLTSHVMWARPRQCAPHHDS